MLTDPRSGLRDKLRRYLGTDTLTDLEATMASVLESLQQLAAQQQAASAAQLTSFTNLQGAVQRLETAVRDGEVSPEIQQAVTDLKAGFDTMLADAQRADDGYEPAPTPAEDVPVEPDTDDTGVVTTVPTEDVPVGTPTEGDSQTVSRSRKR